MVVRPASAGLSVRSQRQGPSAGKPAPRVLNEELETLNGEARELEERIAENVALLLEAD